ncbi:helix-turn-helix domain-containing protein [Dactylosporangium sp. NPDC049742]|uniref:helix-turn-helix domain-containing protein n=1 Tax=Dactylosporangium sp. NPDC049742 TaxID=3154737 RepID=UPI00344739CE
MSAHALQYAFARHHQMSPMQYLRRVRLARAHQDLLDVDPTTGATVTAIAARWGFANHSRFTASHHATCGEPPSTTLRDR